MYITKQDLDTLYEAEAFIEQHGGKVSSSVSKKTTYVVVGENPAKFIKKTF